MYSYENLCIGFPTKQKLAAKLNLFPSFRAIFGV